MSMEYRRLGRSGLKVSTISLGGWTTFGGSVDDEQAIAIHKRAFDLGINLFDTADVYSGGKAEVVLGKVLRQLPRKEVVVATKCMGRVWPGPLGAGLSRKHVMDAVDASLTRLGVDYIDLYQAHAPDDDTPLEETLSAFNDLVRAGKVRYLGVSNFSTEETVECMRICERNGWEKIVSHQPVYNLLDRRVEPDLVRRCGAEGVGFIVYSPLAQGVLTGKYAGGKRPEGSRATHEGGKFMARWLEEDVLERADRFVELAREKGCSPAQAALAWVLREPVVSSAIVGATRVEQLEDNVAAASIRLTEEEIEHLDGLFPPTGDPF